MLFYNRKLKWLVAIELKLGVFNAEYKSQMEPYLRSLADFSYNRAGSAPSELSWVPDGRLPIRNGLNESTSARRGPINGGPRRQFNIRPGSAEVV